MNPFQTPQASQLASLSNSQQFRSVTPQRSAYTMTPTRTLPSSSIYNPSNVSPFTVSQQPVPYPSTVIGPSVPTPRSSLLQVPSFPSVPIIPSNTVQAFPSQSNPYSSPTTGLPSAQFRTPQPPAIQFYNPPQPVPFFTPAAPKLSFEDSAYWRHRKIETLNDIYKNYFYKLQMEYDNNETLLNQTSISLKRIEESQNTFTSRCKNIFSYSKKVASKQRRFSKAVELRQRFENELAKFVNTFMKICEQTNNTDYFYKVPCPADFLSNLLEDLETRITHIEETLVELEEITQKENLTEASYLTLVDSIRLMQEKFEIVASMTHDIHKRVEEWQRKYVNLAKELYKRDVQDEFREPADEDRENIEVKKKDSLKRPSLDTRDMKRILGPAAKW
jgi:hypothetical protein